MTQEEFAILQIAEVIRDAKRWESYCKGCKFLGNATWHFADRTGKTHYCNHPDRQDGHHDPRPYGCKGYYYSDFQRSIYATQGREIVDSIKVE